MKKINIKIFICAIVVFIFSTAYAGQKVNQTINLAGNKSASWYLPDQTPGGWVFLQHGFNRNKDHLTDLATYLMDNGIMVLTVNCSVTKGNPSLARDIADIIIENPPIPPNGYTLPKNLIVSGHSAGGLFVCHMGGRLASRKYSGLKGLILFDPVDANNGMTSTMKAVIDFGRPVLAILANSSSCNESNNAYPPLRSLSDAFVGIKLTDNSNHTDAEGSSSGGILNWLCGSPQTHNIKYLKDFTLNWAIDIIYGGHTSEYYPGGSVLQKLISINDAVLIKQITTEECGNGIVENGEECDGGECCDNDCTFTSPNSVCRSASGECDISETCTGEDASCPDDSYKNDGTTCSIGVCQDGQCQGEYNNSPNADFTFSTSGMTVSFTDESSDSDGIIDSYYWEFGDGTSSTEKDPTHTFSNESTYTVKLTVTDNEGASDTISKNVSLGKIQCGASPIAGNTNSTGFNALSYRNALMPLLPAFILLLIWGLVRRFNLEKYFEKE